MEIAPDTKISAVLKENPAAMEAIVSINRHFEKLRNPVLRKILASRVTIGEAARIGGCQVEDFYEKLAPLGFEVKGQATPSGKVAEAQDSTFPEYLQNLPSSAFHYLDVREDLANGNDPFLLIMKAVEQLTDKNTLVLVNTFEPTPLLQILHKRGYDSYTEVKGPDLVYSYFWRKGEVVTALPSQPATQDFEQLLAQYAGSLKKLDVREMEMPLPMVTILNELEWLPTGHALHVTHRRVPQFLLPRLEDRGFQVAIQEAKPEEVYLLIFKPASS
ncbi:DUF2249 domain-containing protein [Nibribacter koreensis]|uniref:DUF2249 domain-containing protein n=1 Tax=Nibribacter koreensis TaxID=1084519 RepID=A0ABP8FDQ5_9BACT